jgi:hypothetical protein
MLLNGDIEPGDRVTVGVTQATCTSMSSEAGHERR